MSISVGGDYDRDVPEVKHAWSDICYNCRPMCEKWPLLQLVQTEQ